MATRYDAIVIGTGQAGSPLASRLSDEGFKTAVIERKHPGGTCVNTGCIPTKTLVASARVAHLARRAAEYGVTLPGAVGIDMKRVNARMKEVLLASRNGVRKWMEGLENGRFYHGHARFEGPYRIRVGKELLEAERIFINTGGRALVPDMPGLGEVPYLTNSSMMEVDYLPEHLAVIGGSYIGLEFAQMFRRFGSRVTVIEATDRLIAREDEEVSAAVREILENEGVEVRLNASCISVERAGNGISIGLDCTNGSDRVAASHVLLAVGRRPNTDDLGLEAAGIETDRRGFIIVDDQLRTNVPGVWAMGDINGRGAFTHTSYNDYEIIAANLFDGRKRGVGDRIACYGLFIDPPLGRIGLTEREVRASGVPALKATLAMSSVGRAREWSETQGFMKVLVGAESKRILGAAILGLNGDEVVHTLLDVMYADAPYTVVEDAMHIHPTVAEYLPTLMGNLEPLE
ncbi:MAG TPA: FAD-containing oxidoreductase [Alphaproteobacteria bacterium]|nr:FAD-containing oxidoreductase [Alphaproteobacteria bacterium]